MRLAKMRLRDKFQELETVESSEIDKKPPAGGRLHAEIDRLKDAKEFYRKTMLETRNIILHSRNIVRINRVKQKGIKKSFDTAYRKESCAMDHALSQINEDNTIARNIHAAEEIRQRLGKNVQHMSVSEFADMIKSEKPFNL